MTTDFQIYTNSASTLSFNLGQDITNAALTWRLSASPDGEALVEKTIGAGIAVSNPSTGALTVRLGAADVADAGLCYHTLYATPSGGSRSAVAAGRVVVMPSIGAAS